MAFWLLKSEPETFSWQQMQQKGAPEQWHGIRNYAARNNMRAMALGDQCFFYHSVTGKAIMGIVEVVALAHPDSTAPVTDGKVVWDCVDVVAKQGLPRPVSIEAIKAEPLLADMVLIRNSRLSVQPVTPEQWARICAMGGL